MTCGKCLYTDGLVYTSLPPKVKCILTGEFHEYADLCDCEYARKVKESLDRCTKAKGEPRLYSSDFIGNDLDTSSAAEIAMTKAVEPVFTGITNTFDPLCQLEVSTPCLICGEPVDLGFVFGAPKICEECKKAVLYAKVLYAKELFKNSTEGEAILD